MDSNPLIRKLETIGELSPDDRSALRALCESARAVEARHDIIAGGARPDHVHLILEGWAARYTLLPDGSRQITAFLIPGDFCDIHAAVLAAMDHGITAITPCRVALVDGDALDRLTAERPALTRCLWWASLVDEAVLREWIVSNGRRDAHSAVSHLLCELHLRMRQIGMADDDSFDLPLTQEELADATGLTAVHVNRVLQRLRSEGLIALRQRVLTIIDIHGLRQAAGFDSAYLHIAARKNHDAAAADG